ncbi:hypothetical protein [Mangrovibacterium lignilyticum]|uniref:hypothetical protein n=1 Tax=Mangrovibacterium lignilyticum TaxID=2668052 RepID=UPI0013D36D49|nr:hypothetical protein [Mangrovibacterium lignilyticum]
MKVIVISDIKSKEESIIPYGLNLAKHLQREVLFVHVVDPRVQQGVPSAVADSSSVTPDTKMTQGEIIEKEILQSEQELETYLSYEISRLNYPLRWDLDLSIGSIENRMTDLAADYPGSLFLLSKEPDNYIFDSQKETIDISKTFNGGCLFVSPGEKFVPYRSVLIPSVFSKNEEKWIGKIHDFLSRFRPVINMLGRPEHFADEEMSALLEIDQLFPKATVNYKVLDKGHFDEEFIDYAEMIDPELIIIMEEKVGFWRSLFKKELIRKLMETNDSPVLYYSRNSI